MIEPIVRDATVFASGIALLSIGLTLTYMTTKVPNFAHGTFATLGLYMGLTVTSLFGQNPYLAVPLAFSTGAVVGYSLYRLALRPLLSRGATIVSLMIATLAFELIIESFLNIYADYVRDTYKIVSRYFFLRSLDFTFLGQPGLFFTAPLTLFVSILLLHLILTRTKFGVAMRATVENPPLAGVVGINVNMVYSVSWVIAGGLAGLAGSLISLWIIGIPDFGRTIIASIFAASIAGGFFSVYGAVLGGLLVGYAEILGASFIVDLLRTLTGEGAWFIPYRPIIPLLIIVVTLLLAPRGITGIDWRRIIRATRGRIVGTGTTI